MRIARYLFIVLMAGAFALAGCGKSSKPDASAQKTPGAIDIGALQQAFPDPSPEVRSAIDQARFNIRYGLHEKTLAALDTLSALPNLTEPQKKAVADAIEQVKAAINARPAPAQ